MLHFLFSTWLGGVICSLIALCIAGPIILAKINKGKAYLQKEAQELRDRLHHANQNASQQNQRNH